MKKYIYVLILLVNFIAIIDILALPESYKSIHQRQSEENQGYIPPAVVHTRVKAPTTPSNPIVTRKVYGFYPYWMGTSYNNTSFRWDLLTHIVFFSLEANGDGTISNLHSWPWSNLVDTAHNNGVKVIIACTIFHGSEIHTLVSSSANRSTLINNLVNQMIIGNADGISIDFEGVWSSSKSYLVKFMQELRTAMNAKGAGYHLTICGPAVDWNGAFDYDQLVSGGADDIVIMAYDYHWSTGDPGPVAPLTDGGIWGKDVTETVDDYTDPAYGAETNQIILGVPYYGYDWPVLSETTVPGTKTSSASSKVYNIAKAGADIYGRNNDAASQTPWYHYNNSGAHQCWYDDAISLKAKYDLVNSKHLDGIAIWALGYDNGTSDLWDAIEEKFTGADTKTPAPVRIVSALFTGTTVTLKWHKADKNSDGSDIWSSDGTPANDIASYKIYTSSDGVSFSLLDTVSAPTTNKIITSVSSLNYYKITAIDNNNNESIPSTIFAVNIDSGSAVLVVDDDLRFGPHTNMLFLESSLYSNGWSFETASADSITTGLIDMSDYNEIIWSTGRSSSYGGAEYSALTVEEQAKITSYLDEGGHFFITGQEIAYDLDYKNIGDTFIRDYLKAYYIGDDAGSSITISGETSSIFDGMSFAIDADNGSSDGGAYDATSPDRITETRGGIAGLAYSTSDKACVYYEGPFGNSTIGRMIYFSFPFETITTPADRKSVIGKVINFLRYGTENTNSAYSVVINEVMWGTGDEYVELYNTTDQDINLNGWSLKDNGGGASVYDFTSSDIIKANSYMLIGKTENASTGSIDVIAPAMALNNTGEYLVLRDDLSADIDIVDASSGWFAGNSTGTSMERIHYFSSGSDSTNWRSSVCFINGRYGSPSAYNYSAQPATSGQVVINEIMWDGDDAKESEYNDERDEYIELFNNTDIALYIGGYGITIGDGGYDDDQDITIKAGAIIPPHGYYLIIDPDAVDDTVFVNETNGMNLWGGGEVVQLFSGTPSAGTLIDIANHTGSWYAGVSDAYGRSMERIDPSISGTVSGNWKTSTGNIGGRIGTPGTENSIDIASIQNVVISEIMWDEGKSGNVPYGEYIELKNLEDTVVDLSGWKIRVGTGSDTDDIEVSIPAGKSIASKDFFLIIDDGAISGIEADLTNSMTLLQGGELIRLYDAYDRLIDSAGQDGPWFAGVNDNYGKSMERIDYSESGTISTNWQTSAQYIGMRYGSPGADNFKEKINVVISEIMWDEREYIELFNNGNSTVDLSGWKITAGDGGIDDAVEVIIPSSTSLANGAYFLISDSGAVTGITPDLIDAMNFNQGGEIVQLLNSADEIQDTVNRNGPWFAGVNDDQGISMERKDFSVSGTVVDNWMTSREIYGGRNGTPGKLNSNYTVSSNTNSYRVFINEIMWDGYEYIELKNSSSSSVNIGGWYITSGIGGDSDKIDFTIADGKTIPAQGLFLIAESGALTGITPDQISTMSFFNGGEIVRLWNSKGNIIDTANKNGEWFAGENTDTGVSMERKEVPIEGTSATAWYTSSGYYGGRNGTPGKENSSYYSNIVEKNLIKNFKATPASDGVLLQWIGSLGTTAVKYNIYVSGSPITENNKHEYIYDVITNSFASTNKEYRDINGLGGEVLYYAIDAVNSNGNSGLLSTNVSVTTYKAVFSVVINEIMWDQREYIELLNNGNVDVDLGGWKITSGTGGMSDVTNNVEFTIPSGKVISVGGYFLIAESGAVTNITPNYIHSMTFKQSGEIVQLVDNTDNIVDIVNRNGIWFAGKNTDTGVSMERLSPLTCGTLAGSWTSSTKFYGGRNGSPGIANSVYSNSIVGKTSWINAYFNTPPTANNIDHKLVDILNYATNGSTIYAAFYAIDNEMILDAFIAVANRGVTVKLITDHNYYTNSNYKPGYDKLEAAGIIIKTEWKLFDSEVHNKFCVINDRYLWTGSYNITKTGSTRNNNNALLIDSPSLCAEYIKEFNEMYVDNTFGKYKKDNTIHDFVVDGNVIKEYMAPSDNVKQHIIDAINNAKSSIYFCLFSITDYDIAKAIKDKALYDNVKVGGVVDAFQSHNAYSKYSYFTNAGLSVRKDKNPGFLHHKFIIIDYDTSDAVLLDGSYNMTAKANTVNDENILFIYNRSIASWFYDEYMRNVNGSWISTSDYYSLAFSTSVGSNGLKLTYTSDEFGSNDYLSVDTISTDSTKRSSSSTGSDYDVAPIREYSIAFLRNIDEDEYTRVIGDNDNDGIQDEDFNNPIQLTFTLKDMGISMKTNYLYLIGYRDADEQWVYFDKHDTTIDRSAGTVSVNINRSGNYGIFMVEEISGFDSVRVYPSPYIDNNSSYSSSNGIRFELLPIETNEIRIYNIRGQLICTIRDLRQGAGSTYTYWDTCDDNGDRVSSGMYFYVIIVDNKEKYNGRVNIIR